MSACPPIYLVAEFVTKSAPSKIGLYSTGLQKVLSTTDIIPFTLAHSQIFFISHIFKVGLVGVSIQMTLVFDLRYLGREDKSHISMKSTSIL
jgi:hypothetical protein